jgi:hypothetical protein
LRVSDTESRVSFKILREAIMLETSKMTEDMAMVFTLAAMAIGMKVSGRMTRSTAKAT